MLRVFIGYDGKEISAYHVLAHSILSRASIPVAIIPLNRDNLKGIFTRERGEMESTDFSISRFLVPYLSDYEGWSVFMDCDMLCLTDIAELMALIEPRSSRGPQSRRASPVYCAQHDYTPKTEKKFLEYPQTKYAKKNWSSLMVFNNAKCRNLTPEVVNLESGLFLHQFKWAKKEVGHIPLEWNWLIDEYPGLPANPKILHFTNGGPWFKNYENCTGAQLWKEERARMLTT